MEEETKILLGLGIGAAIYGWWNGWFSGMSMPIAMTTGTPAPVVSIAPVIAPVLIRTTPNATDIAAMSRIPDPYKPKMAQILINYGINPQLANDDQIDAAYYGTTMPPATQGNKLI